MSDYLTEYQAWLDRRRETKPDKWNGQGAFFDTPADWDPDAWQWESGPRWQYVSMDIRFGEPDYSAVRDAVYEGDDDA